MRNGLAYIVLFLSFFLSLNAIGQGAGKLVFNVSKGSSEWSDWFYLVTSPDETTPQTVEFFFEGPVANYSFIQKFIVVNPGEIKHVNITVTIPAYYTGPLQLTGKLYSRPVVESAGQVKIVGQLSKNMEINILPPQSPQTTSTTEEKTGGGVTGRAVESPPNPLFVIAGAMLVLVVLGFLGGYFYFRKKNKLGS